MGWADGGIFWGISNTVAYYAFVKRAINDFICKSCRGLRFFVFFFFFLSSLRSVCGYYNHLELMRFGQSAFILIPLGMLIAPRLHYTNGLQKKGKRETVGRDKEGERGGERGETGGKEKENIFLPSP